MRRAKNAYSGKRLFDLLLVIPALILLSPIMAAVAVLVRFTLGPPVLFRQQRPGRYAHSFTILKFKTMTDSRDAQGRLLPDVQRQTAVGRFLRLTSLDELPELLNVLKGDMSLVGPRPLLTKYLPYYSVTERRRFDVLPGITGWAQINGRNDLGWNERFSCDVWYVENASLALDIKILWLTLLRVAGRKNIQLVPGLALNDLDAERGRKTAEEPHRAAGSG